MKTSIIFIFSLLLCGVVFGQLDSSKVISGRLQCLNGWPLAGQIVVLTDTLSGQKIEQNLDSSGVFLFQNVPIGRTYQLSLKNEFPEIDTLRAISVLDLVKISHHILGIRSLDIAAQIAADLNESFGVTTFDLVVLTQFLQGKRSAIGIKKSLILLNGTTAYSHNIIPNFSSSLWGLHFVYVIKGDVDGSGCP
ncbi:hypothetical protein [Haliscomenobacter hydrossis]|uniref:Carboxypeptidase regulatory-like domain-containing protein n=1 Tax=Haliscomenobacter hydrossis (strain ATCC 27775 / DSM 1100 / LMG 10767 / O) TaxID=760192 RepID=F4KT88_HALH1|nr:hypothetical protein [Haliscomenobacter hydrossis]AEE51145.1 hypothetical protein Halhy_3286 [Haliscomenobacter hydrossis DSM 1100]